MAGIKKEPLPLWDQLTMNLTDSIYRLLRPIRESLRLLISKAVVDSVTSDSEGMQVLQVIIGRDEALDSIERVQPLGLTSVPRKGDEAVIVLVNGERQHALCIAVDASSRRVKGLEEGEVCVYKDDANKIVFKKNGDIEIHGEGDLKITPSGAIELGTSAAVKALVNETFATLFDTHTHLGVTVGGGVTGVPAVPLPPTILTTKTKAE